MLSWLAWLAKITGQGQQQQQQSGQYNRPPPRDLSHVRCNHCGEFGHYQDRCPTKLQEQKAKDNLWLSCSSKTKPCSSRWHRCSQGPRPQRMWPQGRATPACRSQCSRSTESLFDICSRCLQRATPPCSQGGCTQPIDTMTHVAFMFNYHSFIHVHCVL